MRFIYGVVGSVIGGIIGATIWALVAYFAHLEIAWIAIGIGVLCGLGMALGVKGEGNFMTGAVAAVIAFLSICAGKYITVEMILQKQMKDERVAEKVKVTDEDAQMYMANQLVGEAKTSGTKLAWPGGKEPEEGADKPTDFPPSIWKDVQARWKAMDDSAKTQYVAAVQRQADQMMSALVDTVRQKGFLASFDFLDILFVLVAVIGAFKGGAGMFDND